MGIKTSAFGSLLPEIQSRHGSTIPFVHRLTWQYFRKTATPVQKKLSVASSLLLSKETFGVGCMPILNTTERQALHRHIMVFYRKATSSGLDELRDINHGISDVVLRYSFELKAPYTYVRFHRLRLSIRFFNRAPFSLVLLAAAAVKDARSWMYALVKDLEWLTACDGECVYDLRQWYAFVNAAPKQARNLVRKICNSRMARSVTLGECRPAVMVVQATFTCFCGQMFKSLAALNGHRGAFHEFGAAEMAYCPEDATCRACLVSFSNRKLLAHHLRYRSGYVCLLSCVAHQQPLSDLELDSYRTAERVTEAQRGKWAYRDTWPRMKKFAFMALCGLFEMLTEPSCHLLRTYILSVRIDANTKLYLWMMIPNQRILHAPRRGSGLVHNH